MDNIVLAATYRLQAIMFQDSAEILLEAFQKKGMEMPGNLKAVPFYYLMSHSIELLIKCALLKRGFRQEKLKKFPIRHSLSRLLETLLEMDIPISEGAISLINLLSQQHEQHRLRYTAIVKIEGEDPIFTPEPSDLFLLMNELLMAGAISTYGR